MKAKLSKINKCFCCGETENLCLEHDVDDVEVRWFVECNKCGACGSSRNSQEGAIKTWNWGVEYV